MDYGENDKFKIVQLSKFYQHLEIVAGGRGLVFSIRAMGPLSGFMVSSKGRNIGRLKVAAMLTYIIGHNYHGLYCHGHNFSRT